MARPPLKLEDINYNDARRFVLRVSKLIAERRRSSQWTASDACLMYCVEMFYNEQFENGETTDARECLLARTN